MTPKNRLAVLYHFLRYGARQETLSRNWSSIGLAWIDEMRLEGYFTLAPDGEYHLTEAGKALKMLLEL